MQLQIATGEFINLSKRKIDLLVNNVEKSAQAIALKYVHDSQPGITRIKKGKNFAYFLNGERITDTEELLRIKHLVIPPAWTNVWICTLPNGHLQATGIDLKKRKQYKYHLLWNALRNHTKFHRLYEFGKALPEMREHINKDLSLPGMPLDKVLATVVRLMERTHIRIGNGMYEKLYGSYGLTTMKNGHVQLNGNTIKFTFKGKKGVHHSISIRSKRLASIVKRCKDIPGKELFQYFDDNGEVKSIDSGMVNSYIKNISGKDFTTKDFRTWAGSVHALEEFKEKGHAETDTETKRRIVEVLDSVSKQLGNTRTVCKKYYVHPTIISLYEEKKLMPYFETLATVANDKNSLSAEEQLLIKLL